MTLPGGEYGFYPQFKRGAEGTTITAQLASLNSASTSYATYIYLCPDAAGRTVYAQQRYVTSSGEVCWIFFFRNKKTGIIETCWVGPDHPCMGNGGKPLLMPYPSITAVQEKTIDILDINGNAYKLRAVESTTEITPVTHDIVVVNPNESEIVELYSNAISDNESIADPGILRVIMEQYEIDEKGGSPDWPSGAVTVGLPAGIDWKRMPDGTPVTPIKKVIPKMDYIITRTLRRKGLKEI